MVHRVEWEADREVTHPDETEPETPDSAEPETSDAELEPIDTAAAERRARKMADEYRLRRAVDLARAGLPWALVAKGSGYASKGAALKAVNRYLAAKRAEMAESAEVVREMELDRLDALQSAVWDRARHGDDKALSRVLDIHDRRVKLDPNLAAAVVKPELNINVSAEVTARQDRDLASLVLDLLLSLADDLDFTPEQRVRAPQALLSAMETRGMVPPSAVGDGVVVAGSIEP